MCAAISFPLLPGHSGESMGKNTACLAPPLSLNPEGCAMEVLPSHPDGMWIVVMLCMEGEVLLHYLLLQCVGSALCTTTCLLLGARQGGIWKL